MSDIAKLIQKNAGTYGVDAVVMLTCIVDSVDEGKRLCMVSAINNNLGLFPAQLMPDIDDGILILPAEGSTVKVLFSNLNAPTVIQYSEVDKVFIVAGGSTLLIYSAGIELMGNKYGGIPEVKPLTKIISDLQKDLNALKRVFSASWTPVPNDGGAALKVAAGAWAGQVFTPTVRADIENDRVLHGDGS